MKFLLVYQHHKESFIRQVVYVADEALTVYWVLVEWMGIQRMCVFKEDYSYSYLRQGEIILLKRTTPARMILIFIPSLTDSLHPSLSQSEVLLFTSTFASVFTFSSVFTTFSSVYFIYTCLTSSLGFCFGYSVPIVLFDFWAACQSSMVTNASLRVYSGQQPPILPASSPFPLQIPTQGKPVMVALAMQRSQCSEQSMSQNQKLHSFYFLSSSSTCFSIRQYLQLRVKNFTNLYVFGLEREESKFYQVSGA